jgi:FixJ family two-component response regulator
MALMSPSPRLDYVPVISIVDDDASVREALLALFESVGFKVALYSSVQEFVSRSPANETGCLVLDVRMPGQSGLEYQAELVRSNIRRPIIFISGHADVPMTVRAMKAGAVEFLTKPIRHQDLLEAVNSAITKDRIQREEARLAATASEAFSSLTKREREIMSLIILGRRNKQIAAEVGLSEATVKLHRGNVMKKMRIGSLAELIRIAEMLHRSE